MSRLVDQARTWIDVPYVHQGSNKHGADCRGFICGVFAELGVKIEDYRTYGQEADPELLLSKLREAFGDEVARAPVQHDHLLAGDIVLFRFPKTKVPRHLAIIADRPGGGLNFIESNGNERRVIERRLDDKYRAHITHVFRRPV